MGISNCNFMCRAIRGEFPDPEEAVHDAISEWHDIPDDDYPPLHEFLGFSWEEYVDWVMLRKTVRNLIQDRQSGLSPI